MTEKIIIDTDPFIDDAMAIFYALLLPQLEVVGLTTVYGNVFVERGTRNALKLLEIAERPDIPVAVGAAKPLAHAYHGEVPHIHGADGQGNVNLPAPVLEPVSQFAAQFIVEQVMQHPGEITLVPIGPLTNLALALQLEPRIAENVRRVVLMGGAAFVPGNVNPAAEANFYCDPLAADLVLAADWDVTMVGLDVTHLVKMTGEHMEVFSTSQRAMSQHIARIIPVYVEFYRQSQEKMGGFYVHDSTAISYLIAPDAFTVELLPVAVQRTGIGAGKSWAWTNAHAPRPPWAGRNPVNVCLNVDGDRLVQLQLEHSGDCEVCVSWHYSGRHRFSRWPYTDGRDWWWRTTGCMGDGRSNREW